MQFTGTSLVVASVLNTRTSMRFDSTTTFDTNTTTYSHYNTTRFDIYSLIENTLLLSESVDVPINNNLNIVARNSFSASNTVILLAAPNTASSIIEYIGVNTGWQVLHTGVVAPDATKIKNAYLYNSASRAVITYLDVVDTVNGKLPGLAEQEIKFKTYYDPAVYTTGTARVVVDNGLNWTAQQVGLLWWDLNRAKFMVSSSDSNMYSALTWNRLYKTASIDVFEWVESKYSPDEWDLLADTVKGLSLGISGKSKYGNAVYSQKKRYDTISQRFLVTYYFWVKNKTTIPTINSRKLSASDVASLIADPTAYGYPCIALTGPSMFSLVNVNQYLESTSTHLAIQYWKIHNTQLNAHSEWKIISEAESTSIPAAIENKWKTSLVGRDLNNREVPDLSLPIKQRYGIENRPLQGMFVNRIEAVKQYVERVNAVLQSKMIVDSTDLSDLFKLDDAPAASTNQWDISVDTDSALSTLSNHGILQGRLQPVITNGKITDVLILSPGAKYVTPPTLKVIGKGVNAVLSANISQGKITSVDIINQGSGYDDSTIIATRPFTVLVNSDATSLDKWSLYSWGTTSKSWAKIKTQIFDVTKFWKYADWYVEGYNQYTKVDYLVENIHSLIILDAPIGSIVKVKMVGTGGWMMLYKYADVTSSDYTLSYSVVGRNNGTIQFNSNLYKFKTSTAGFDNAMYDSVTFDNVAAIELGIIIDVIKNKILINDLRVEYINLFFASLRYVMAEQLYVDWAFKTSFVKAIHNAGLLNQKTTYRNDNLANFEDYINEVKPYRTKVRSYVSAYTGSDISGNAVSDFDCPTIVNPDFTVSPLNTKLAIDGTLVNANDAVNRTPWKDWYSNLGYSIQEISIISQGSGYSINPTITFSGMRVTGSVDPVVKAKINNGRLVNIEVINGGSGWIGTPSIQITDTSGSGATASVTIGGSLLRATRIGMKFDRITSASELTTLACEETFTGNGSKVQYLLNWAPDLTTSATQAFVNNSELLPSTYTLEYKKIGSRFNGVITFDVPPANGASIKVQYLKNVAFLSAADRINFFYGEQSGESPFNIGQVMPGVDYGGVDLTGIGFNTTSGWDEFPWISSKWSVVSVNASDFTTTIDANTTKI